MGRYTNVQSYADNSPTMRTVSYAQATGRTANNTTSDSPSRDTSDVQQLSASLCDGDAHVDENITTDKGKDISNPSQLKSEEPKESKQQQEQHRSSISPSSCETTSLFVGGLHPRIADLHLQKLFSPYGEIERIHIVTHNPNDSKPNVNSKSAISAKYVAGLHQSKGYAFVEYKSIESARLAISRLDGRPLMGRSLAVRPSRRKPNEGGRVGSGGDSGKAGTKVSAEEARREYGAVQSKIDAVKRAIEQKKRGI